MVFALLAITMIATRKLDWTELSKRLATRAPNGKPQPAAGS
jgi:inner membrane protein involved in colicin E2 resistance